MQVVPHITDEIKQAILRVSAGMDVTIVEIGGTVGDIESLPFLEAIRQMPYDVGRENVLYVHLTLVPFISAAGELKTKPTQHSVNKLREIGIQANILLCRTDRYLPPDLKGKIALFCNVEKDAVITAKDVETIYEVPIVFRKEGLDELIVKLLRLDTGPPDLRQWDAMVQKIKYPKHEVMICLVGKYVGLKESYKSLTEALVHGGIDHETRVQIRWVESEEVTRAGVPIALSAREYAVLEALMLRPGAILSRAQLEDRLYGWGDAVESNAVSVYIHQLRRKLGADAIRNVRGVGYYVGRTASNA